MVPVPVMTMVVLGGNATDIIDYKGQFGDRFGMDYESLCGIL
jgi:hypothetical protein